MEWKVLSDGNRMPVIGLGMFQAKDAQEVESTVLEAIDAGYRHIDTAFAYRNESFIGRALQKAMIQGKAKREDLYIVTKLPGNGLQPDAVEYFLQKSLAALTLDYVDLYHVHFPVASKRTDDDYNIFPTKDGVFEGDETVDLVKTWQAMEKLVDKGVAKSIGISNFNSEQIQRIYNAARIKPSVLQVECHAYLPQFELHELCKSFNMVLTAYSPIGAPGQAEFKSGEIKEQKLIDDPRLVSICEKHKKSPAQVLLRYLVQRGIVVIPKSTNPKRLRENIQIFNFSLSEGEMEILKSMGRNRRYFTFESYPGLNKHPEYPFNIPF